MIILISVVLSLTGILLLIYYMHIFVGLLMGEVPEKIKTKKQLTKALVIPFYYFIAYALKNAKDNINSAYNSLD